MARKPKIQPKISIIIPFTSGNSDRREIFKWTTRYWDHEIPDAEIVIGHSPSTPFCKTEALNNAARKANGKVLAIMDADAYIDGSIISEVADTILEELELGNRVWYIPYRNLYRLNEFVTEQILDSDPENPIRLPDPPPDSFLDDEPGGSKYGRSYAALAYMIPVEALEVLGCFDERFNKGWGGEDISTLMALDTLYAKHKSTNNGIFHLWHPKIGDSFKTRAWEGQTEDEPNHSLARTYRKATQNPSEMRALVDAGCEFGRRRLEAGILWDGFDDFMLEVFADFRQRNRKKFG